MKTILGLDLGTTSIGWALVKEAESKEETSSIIKIGVRVNPLSTDESTNFEKGKPITTNAERTLKRSARRNLQRYKLRRDNLKQLFIEHNFIEPTTCLSEDGKESTFETCKLRALAATTRIELLDFVRVLFMINKKRGYKSARKMKDADGGALIDGMDVAKELYEDKITPGQFVYTRLCNGAKYIPDFYRSDLQAEIDLIWDFQSNYHAELLTDDFKTQIRGKGKLNISKIFLARYGVYTAENKEKDKRIQAYKWRVNALSEPLTREELAYVVSDLTGIISNSSGYLGAVSDRSKALFFNKQTVGQYQMSQLETNPHDGLKNQIFYRQDYLDEFETIWEQQALYHAELTPTLKREIRDIVIFYQRKLKSQKGLISFCEFESKTIEVAIEGKKKTKTVGSRVSPKSSPLFQEFKIWQILNNIQVTDRKSGEHFFLEQDQMNLLFEELTLKEKLSKNAALKLLYAKATDFDLNYDSIEGNRTISTLFKAYQQIVDLSGHGEFDFAKMKAADIYEVVFSVFNAIGVSTDILKLSSNLHGDALENEPLYLLWHLLYSFAGDNSTTGSDKLLKKLCASYGFEKLYAQTLANVSFQDDYGSLSTKAICKILPHLKEGFAYGGRKERPEEPSACVYAGYRHSAKSLTRAELDARVLKDALVNLPKGSLRNPIVEKILNQMINVINPLLETYGKPDEIRIELARELKNSAKERENITIAMRKSTADHEKYRAILNQEFGIKHVSRNDVIRYRLYLELASRGYKTLYSNTYIAKDKLFSKEFDIEHIIPQSRLFDDSFSNKTLESGTINKEKSNETAYDYVAAKYNADALQTYLAHVDDLYKQGAIGYAKCSKLKMKGVDIPDGFIERDLRDSQYIAVKAKSILEEIVPSVVSTTGSVTNRLRADWQLVDVMQELNWDKYNAQGLTEIVVNRDGKQIRKIIDWTKRNDHRHHAMDALTIAFTKRSYIQYLNNLNAQSDRSGSIYAIKAKELERDAKGKMRFIPPFPLAEFRASAKQQLENVLISIKAKNKVVTSNINYTKQPNGKVLKTKQLTPRAQLHNETVYGKIQQYETKEEKVGGSFTSEKIQSVANTREREALLSRLQMFGNDPKKAFTGKNALSKQPIYLDAAATEQLPEKVKLVSMANLYTIRKEISPDLKIEKVVDAKIRTLLSERLKAFGGDSQKAFSNLDANPIWLNQSKGITIKRVTIAGNLNIEALHSKRNKDGQLLLDKAGNTQPVDFISTSNNHHAAIYKNEKEVAQVVIVSYFETTARATQGIPLVDKTYMQYEGWEFLFTMKQNEYFVFANKETGFNPHGIDLLDPVNYGVISPNLFRVQKISKNDYWFRHHLETNVQEIKNLKDIVYKRCNSLGFIDEVVKVRINHLGEIVSVGEY